ncbi:MAG: alpha-hydroxy-acid oxidizing protein [Clostridia bacterium]|nr:alpha-hydroxy-acid oxidizing protein [Clostridia bacterium]
MTIQEVLLKAKENIGPRCKVCPECNGLACKGQIPGPGGKGTGVGFIRNYQDLRKISLNMDTIYEAGEIDTSTTLFGHRFELPVFAGPVGAVAMHYSDVYNDQSYNASILTGCKEAGILAFTGDGVQDEVFEGAISAIDSIGGYGIPTIKPWKKDEIIKKIMMAERAGAVAVAMDIDTAGLAILAAQGKPVSPISVETLEEIVSATKLPLILKGIMTVEGAKKALKAGASGIIVSNHGGRVLDETPSTISKLGEIVRAVGGQMTIFVDGGFRSGIDVFKALALGADGVLIARPYVSAVYGGDVEGVKLYTEKIHKELKDAMLMTGCHTIKEITMNKVTIEG